MNYFRTFAFTNTPPYCQTQQKAEHAQLMRHALEDSVATDSLLQSIRHLNAKIQLF